MRIVACLADRNAVALIEEQCRIALVILLVVDDRSVGLVALAYQRPSAS
jgi:hypothetical protein